jgi:glycosyltransferase involved in cell wall biosynthesis
MRRRWGVSGKEILVVYTGRFSADKNPLILARAVSILRKEGKPFKAVYVGSGDQEREILGLPGNAVIEFMRHVDLAAVYRAADVGVWPRQESMSMLDASSSGLPVVASNKMGERSRVEGNGCVFEDNNAASLAHVLSSLLDPSVRRRLGDRGREKMKEYYSWKRNAQSHCTYYEGALRRGK